ncbi:MAG: DegV family protein [Anaerolineales bacterium]|nr:DegV family protein [Anaerolineales bacterium]
MIKLVTDSSCNLPASLIQGEDLSIVPLAIQFGNDTYLEDVTIDRDTFYRKIEELGIIPTTSQPSPAHFVEIYKKNAAEGHETLVITVTSKHSGTYNSALLAKSLTPQAKVEVWDSLSCSMGTGFQVLEALKASKQGKSIAEIKERLAEIRERIHITLTPATLKYLRMSGRVGILQTTLATALQLKPIIEIREGTLELTKKIRSRTRAVQQLITILGEQVGRENPINLAVVHGHALEEGKELLKRVKQEFNCRTAVLEEMVSSLAVHGGPGLLALIAYRV